MPTFIFGTKTLKLFIFMKNWNSRATLKCRLWAIKFGTVSYYGIHNGKMVRANWNFNFWFFWAPLLLYWVGGWMGGWELWNYNQLSLSWSLSWGFGWVWQYNKCDIGCIPLFCLFDTFSVVGVGVRLHKCQGSCLNKFVNAK